MIFFSNNKIVPINTIKISYNDEKCFHCNLDDMILNGFKNNLSYCSRCEKYFLLVEYISKDKYYMIIREKTNAKTISDNIKKINFDEFIKSTNI